MDWRAKVELYEKIRREFESGGTILGVAKKLGVHRRMVREAIRNAIPPTRKKVQRETTRLVAEVMLFIHQILVGDQQAPRKQRHTAQRIHQRLREEMPQQAVSPRSVRRAVREWKQQRQLEKAETFISQEYSTGCEAQVDWYEAYADLGGERVKLQVFSMRSMYSGAAYHRAYPRATQLAFLDGMARAFEMFGGVFAVLRFDNLKHAVKRILQGKRREETTRFVAFRSHYLFDAEFCQPARGNEKGGVEGEVGRFRRQWWTPVPQFANLDELNAYLSDSCRRDHERTIEGRGEAVGIAFAQERVHLKPRPAEEFDLCEKLSSTVDSFACVSAKTNRYSTPLRPGTRAEVYVEAAHVTVFCAGQLVARHERSYSKRQEVLHLEHYLSVLERKPGAFAHSKALAQYRQGGQWPESFDQLWTKLKERQGASAGTREMIRLLAQIPVHGQAAFRQAVETALHCGASDAASVMHLLKPEARAAHEAAPLANSGASYYDRPLPELSIYDQLLVAAVKAEVRA